MTIFLDSTSRVVVQGMTGAEGRRHTARMLASGTTIVGGVNPRKAGTAVSFDVGGGEVHLPVFGAVTDAVREEGADVSVIFVPRQAAREAIVEATDAGISLVVVITEGIPVADVARALAHAQERGTRLIGPNCPGIISPGRSNVGITPAIAGPGPIGLVSRSGTLTYQMMHELEDIGFTTCVGIGGDPVVGTTHLDCLEAFEADPETTAIVLIGEIGGDDEERAARYIRDHVTKPVIGYVAGFTAPEGRTMGHAGAIVSGTSGTAEAKKRALEAAGVEVGTTPTETAGLVREAMSR